jgi:hypothetical protein
LLLFAIHLSLLIQGESICCSMHCSSDCFFQYYFRCASMEQKLTWVRVLTDAISAARNKDGAAPGGSAASGAGTAATAAATNAAAVAAGASTTGVPSTGAVAGAAATTTTTTAAATPVEIAE